MPTWPFGNVAVPLAGPCAMTSVNGSDALAPAASVRVMLSEKVPLAVGVPESTPTDDRVRPAGTPFADHAYGVVPPVPPSVVEYATVVSPLGSGDVDVIDGRPLMVIVYCFVAVPPKLSVSVTVNVEDP